jgi:hypothetical protein
MHVRADREIVDDILQEICEAGVSDPPLKLIELRINQLIELLRALKPYGPPKDNRKSNKKFAKKIIPLIDTMQEMLADPSKNFAINYAFTPPPAGLLTDPDAVDYQKAGQRQFLHAALHADMRRRFQWMIEHEVGEYGRSGYQQKRAAMASRELLEPLEIPLHYGSSTSVYCRVTSLFFEVMTGLYDAEGPGVFPLERACEAMARYPNAPLLMQLPPLMRLAQNPGRHYWLARVVAGIVRSRLNGTEK